MTLDLLMSLPSQPHSSSSFSLVQNHSLKFLWCFLLSLTTSLSRAMELCLTEMSLTVPFIFFISIFMQLFVTLLGEISTEISSSRTTLGHEVCETKCDSIRCSFICQFYAPAFHFFSCSTVEQHPTCPH